MLALALALVLAAGAAVEADQAVVPLGELLSAPDVIALGVVVDTVNGQLPGDFLVLVDVEEALKGEPVSRFTLLGNDRNSDTFPRLPKGTRILAFLEGSLRDGFGPIAGEQGVLVVDEASADVGREIVLRGLKAGAKLGLPDVDDLLRNGTPAPPALLGSLTEELSLRLTGKDQGAVAEIVCEPDAFLPAVQFWAMSRVGVLQAMDARPCLEDFLKDPKNTPRVLASSEALGELGDPASAPALLGLLESLPADRRIFGRDRRGDSTAPGGPLDPEDESDPRPDPGESSKPGEIELLPPGGGPGDRDGEREPDGAPSDDRVQRDGSGGIATSAVLALGKIGDPSAVPLLFRIARQGDDLSLHSTAVSALGLIGGRTVVGPLRALGRSHPNPLIRAQAEQTLERVRKGGAR